MSCVTPASTPTGFCFITDTKVKKKNEGQISAKEHFYLLARNHICLFKKGSKMADGGEEYRQTK